MNQRKTVYNFAFQVENDPGFLDNAARAFLPKEKDSMGEEVISSCKQYNLTVDEMNHVLNNEAGTDNCYVH